MNAFLRVAAVAAVATVGLTVRMDGVFQAPEKLSGIYVQPAGETSADSWQRLSAAMVEDVEVNGLAKSMFTGGFLKPKMTGSIPNAAAATRVSTGNLVFEFHFAEMPRGRPTMEDMLAMHSDQDGLPLQAKKPGEFTLVLIQPADERRPIGGKSPSFKFKEQKISARVFRLTPNAPLTPGEYAFLFGKNGAAGVVWDFGVDGQ